MASIDELLSQALTLRDTERAQIVRGLLQCLDAPGGAGDGAADDLAHELRRRLERIESGEADLINADDAMDELQAAQRRRMHGNT